MRVVCVMIAVVPDAIAPALGRLLRGSAGWEADGSQGRAGAGVSKFSRDEEDSVGRSEAEHRRPRGFAFGAEARIEQVGCGREANRRWTNDP